MNDREIIELKEQTMCGYSGCGLPIRTGLAFQSEEKTLYHSMDCVTMAAIVDRHTIGKPKSVEIRYNFT